MKKLIQKFKHGLAGLVSDEERRSRVQYLAVYGVLCSVSFIMTVVNFFTGKTVLMYSTLIFSLLCGLNYVLARTSKRGIDIAVYLFVPELLALFTFFIVKGDPEGFSAIWCAILPASGLLLFKLKGGTVLSFVMLLILVFFYWTPFGKSLLMYRYTDSFMLRFPLLYTAFFALALFLEVLRSMTFENYLYLSRHDPLTGAMNRAGFKNYIDRQQVKSSGKTVGFIIFDLDRFKRVNDTYGHFSGDAVLKETCARLTKLTGFPLCRWGGEEFALMEVTDVMSQDWVDKIIAGYSAEPFILNGAPVTLTISLGAVSADISHGYTADKLCLEADKLLYAAKENGRNQGIYKKLD